MNTNNGGKRNQRNFVTNKYNEASNETGAIDVRESRENIYEVNPLRIIDDYNIYIAYRLFTDT